YGLCALAAAAMAWPPRDVTFAAHHQVDVLTALQAALLMAEAFVERIDVWSLAEPSALSRIWGLCLTIFLLVPSLVLFARARTRLLFLACLAVFFAFTTLKYGQAWHAGILYMAWVFALWVSWPALATLEPRRRVALFASLIVILGVQAWCAAAAWSREAREVYAPGEEVAKALASYRQRHPGAQVATFGFKTFAVQPWSRANLFDNFNGGAEKPAFYDWRSSQPFRLYPTPPAWAAAIGKDRRGVFLLSDFEHMSDAERAQYFAVAARAGLCARVFDGQMIWKTYDRESLAIAMFTPCGA
ncbi:MAG TPA: hypothetical protein VHX64_09145, partial [Caulobacteraceae bacterium]|nr:hypothetical protein [Caulobacteraceae bacterium]